MYFTADNRLMNYRAASLLKRNGAGLFMHRGTKDVGVEVKQRLQGRGGNERLHLGPVLRGITSEKLQP